MPPTLPWLTGAGFTAKRRDYFNSLLDSDGCLVEFQRLIREKHVTISATKHPGRILISVECILNAINNQSEKSLQFRRNGFLKCLEDALLNRDFVSQKAMIASEGGKKANKDCIFLQSILDGPGGTPREAIRESEAKKVIELLKLKSGNDVSSHGSAGAGASSIDDASDGAGVGVGDETKSNGNGNGCDGIDSYMSDPENDNDFIANSMLQSLIPSRVSIEVTSREETEIANWEKENDDRKVEFETSNQNDTSLHSNSSDSDVNTTLATTIFQAFESSNSRDKFDDYAATHLTGQADEYQDNSWAFGESESSAYSNANGNVLSNNAAYSKSSNKRNRDEYDTNEGRT